MSDANLFAQQEANRRRSSWLIAGFMLFFGWVGFGGDVGLALMTMDSPPEAYHHVVPFIGIITTVFAAATCLWAWFKGSERILWSTGAWEILEPATPELKQLFNVVEEMSIASGVPRPRIWVVPDDDPNAFATGRDPATASIAVTEGLLDTLSRDELQAVVAHEMAHIQNYDVRLTTLLAAMVGAIALLSDGMGRMIRGGARAGGSGRFGGRGGGGGKRGGAGMLGLVILVLWLLTLVVAPLVSRILAMAVSRKREFLADATGAQFTRNPGALASALEKLNAASGPTRHISKGTAHLCIVDPAEQHFAEPTGRLAGMLSSHPPIGLRVARLREMAFQPAGAAAGSTGVVR